jgi:ferredoxin
VTRVSDDAEGSDEVGAPPACGGERRSLIRVSVDADRCTGHGRCYTLAPDVFDADEVGHCVVLVEDVSGELEAQAITGEQNCPEQAITLSR